MTNPTPNLQRTVDALAELDAFIEENDCTLSRLERAVNDAFALDTIGFNDPATVATMRVGGPTPRMGETDVSFIRQMARRFQAEATP